MTVQESYSPSTNRIITTQPSLLLSELQPYPISAHLDCILELESLENANLSQFGISFKWIYEFSGRPPVSEKVLTVSFQLNPCSSVMRCQKHIIHVYHHAMWPSSISRIPVGSSKMGIQGSKYVEDHVSQTASA